MGELLSAAKEDFKDSTSPNKVGLFAASTFLGVHEVGMEAALGVTAGTVLNSTSNPVAVGAAMGALSYWTEIAMTHVVSSGIERFPRLSQTKAERDQLDIKEEHSNQAAEKPESKLNKASEAFQKGSLLIGLGSAGLILREHAISPQRTREDNIKTGKKAAKFLLAFNAALGTIVSGGAKAIDQTGVNASEFMIVHAQDPKTWIALFAAGRAFGYIDHRKKKKARQERRGEEQTNTTNCQTEDDPQVLPKLNLDNLSTNN